MRPGCAAQGVNAVVFSGFGAAHRLRTDLGAEPALPWLDRLLASGFKAVRASLSK